MSITRREFIKISAVTTGLAAIADFGFGGPVTTLVKKAVEQGSSSEDIWLPTTCWIGKQDCGVLARRVDGRIINLEGHPDHPRNHGTLCPKGVAQIIQVYDPYRVKAPLKRTNRKGESGVWEEISWDEALTTVAAQLKAVRETDKRLFIWHKGRSKAKPFYDNAFNKAYGTVNKLSHGATCSDAVYRANELTFSVHGSTAADFNHCRYLISWGWNITEAGGPHLCFLTWPKEILDAKERGMKIVQIDPRIRSGAHLVDEWLPIKPGTDMTLALAMANVLLDKGHIDTEYLNMFTNAPFLVGPNGLFYKVDNKEQIWDRTTESARPHDEIEANPALYGTYMINNVTYKTAFQLYREHIAQYTPQWASDICGLSTTTIQKVAEDFGENAMIGQKHNIDGIELPYRPVAIGTYHASQQEMGTQAWRAITMLNMLVGAVDTIGSSIFWDRKVQYSKYQGKWESMVNSPDKIKAVPEKLTLDSSKFYPITSGGLTQAPITILDAAKGGPDRYGLPYKPEDMVMLMHMVNPVISGQNEEIIKEAYSKLQFVVSIDPWINETADLFADIVLPAATMEKYEGPLSLRTLHEKADSLRMPIIDPLFKSRGEIEIYIDLCEKIGILFGEEGYLDYVNKELKLPSELALSLDKKPSIEEIFDRWARSKGKDLDWFKENSVKVSKISTDEFYMRAWEPPHGGIKAHLYSEILLRFGRIMKDKGADKIYYQDYTAFPTWRTPTIFISPDEYDLNLITYKKVEHKQSRTAFNALLNELEPENHLQMNAQTARAKDISDGDTVWVESHNGRTNDTYKVQAKVDVIQGIRPDTVALSAHYGHWKHPVARHKGVSSNRLYPTGEGYIDMTGNQSFNVMVKVYK
jgi:anaerobic selenocysteine-containing dehydrogenase